MLKLLLAAAIAATHPEVPAEEYAEYYVVISEAHGEDPFLTTAIGIYESGLDNTIVSGKGACCIMQVLGDKYSVFPTCRKVKRSVELCIEAGISYLAKLRKKHKSDEEVLCRYNAGNTCSRASRLYAKGVLWWRYRLLAIASEQPAGRWSCTIEIKDPAGTLIATDTAPVWVRAIPHGRPAIRNYEENALKSLKLTLKYRTCNIRHLGVWDGRRYLDEDSEAFECLTSRRRYSCAFEELQGEQHLAQLDEWAGDLVASTTWTPGIDITWAKGGTYADAKTRRSRE